MSAIDFSKLLREERRKSKKPKARADTNKQTKETDSFANRSSEPAASTVLPCVPSRFPKWSPDEDSLLALENVDLQLVCSSPASIHYSPKALQETVRLQQWLKSLPHGDSGLEEWKTMKYGKRRVCMFGERSSTGEGILPPPLAALARELCRANIFPADQPPNHVLLNEYQPSQGILPHTDGPSYASRTATLSIGSDVVLEFTKRLTADEIGGDISQPEISEPSPGQDGTSNSTFSSTLANTSKQPIQILLHADSLIVFEQEAYIDYCHGIRVDQWQDTTTDTCLNAKPGLIIPRGHRFSLTFRHKLLTNTLSKQCIDTLTMKP